MSQKKTATRYARALHAALPDPRQVESADRFLAELAAAMRSSPEIRKMLLDPSVPRSVRADALEFLAERAEAGPLIGRFLRAIVKNQRVKELPAVAEAFHAEREKALGVVPVSVTTAAPVSDALSERLRESLQRLTGRRVRVSMTVDPSLIGGVVTRVGSLVYDGSLRCQLSKMRRRMAEG